MAVGFQKIWYPFLRALFILWYCVLHLDCTSASLQCSSSNTSRLLYYKLVVLSVVNYADGWWQRIERYVWAVLTWPGWLHLHRFPRRETGGTTGREWSDKIENGARPEKVFVTMNTPRISSIIQYNSFQRRENIAWPVHDGDNSHVGRRAIV